jgi:Pentapeptide repeats (8 copies)
VADQELLSLIAVAIAIVLLSGTLLVGIWWLWWRLPKWQVSRLALKIRDAKARADVEDNFRKTVGQALGGAAVLIGAAFALFQFLQQQKAAHDLLISNQVSKGFEQLASDKMAMRLGGIYALEGVMNTSEDYNGAVLEGLCAFVRENTTGKNASENKPAIDVQAALTVIGRRVKGIWVRVDLINVGIRGANLSIADLSHANLNGADLRGADLGIADLSHADLHGADLRGADLRVADLRDAYLGKADLRGANLNEVKNLTQEQLDEACANGDTKLPKGLTLKAMCKQ